MSDHRFVYQYRFQWQNMEVKCKLNEEFDNIESIEDLSKIPHAKRRNWALKLLHKYGNADDLYAITSSGRPAYDSHHILNSDDFSCPFGAEILNHLSLPMRLTMSYIGDNIQLVLQAIFLI